MFDKHLQNTKNEVGKQMHEMCSMVEEIAQMNKGLEYQLELKKPEIEANSNAVESL